MLEVVVIGGGQAGLAAGACLAQMKIEHLVVEKGEIGESWRRYRWDNFSLVTPNWTINLPGYQYDGTEPNGFLTRDEFVQILEKYAEEKNVCVRTGLHIFRAIRSPNGWQLETSNGEIKCRALIIATSNYQKPNIPELENSLDPEIYSLSSAEYKSSNKLPTGGVLVVGSAQSGCQIAEDLLIDGRDVTLSVSRAGRLPRRYRGRDAIDWQNRMGFLDKKVEDLENIRMKFGGEPHMTGRNGGYTISLQGLEVKGVRLVGRLNNIQGSTCYFDNDLNKNVCSADNYSKMFCDSVDKFIKLAGNDVDPDNFLNDTIKVGHRLSDGEELSSVNLKKNGITTVIWATGFTFDFSWILEDVLDSDGYPITNRGISKVPGLYFLGLNYLYSRKSGIIFGIEDDAIHVTQHVENYLK